jgi:hypothetical protein
MLRTAAVASLCLLLAGTAAAKDVCVMDDVDFLVFKGVKSLKKPGRVVPLYGIYVHTASGRSFPIAGSATVRSDGQVVFGVLVHALLSDGPQHDISVTMIGDATFQAVGHTDSDGDGDVNTSDSWNPIDCDGVVLP